MWQTVGITHSFSIPYYCLSILTLAGSAASLVDSQYSYKNRVQDEYSSSKYKTKEDHDLSITSRMYTALLPDGWMQTVTNQLGAPAGYVVTLEDRDRSSIITNGKLFKYQQQDILEKLEEQELELEEEELKQEELKQEELEEEQLEEKEELEEQETSFSIGYGRLLLLLGIIVVVAVVILCPILYSCLLL
eukprot:GFUD01026972.1.p1 GENE.GFUD01026972.1~~GFUD01026972.1.p1  ORF type:complete len:198 (+),score=59.77 GFUD01026972.1:25-594(+)